jgi:hypothetical protein
MQIKYGKDREDGKVINITGFLLPKVPTHPECCQLCGKELTEYEKKNPGEIQWRKDGKLMEVASAYYCFDCVQKITGEKIEEPQGERK